MHKIVVRKENSPMCESRVPQYSNGNLKLKSVRPSLRGDCVKRYVAGNKFLLRRFLSVGCDVFGHRNLAYTNNSYRANDICEKKLYSNFAPSFFQFRSFSSSTNPHFHFCLISLASHVAIWTLLPCSLISIHCFSVSLSFSCCVSMS